VIESVLAGAGPLWAPKSSPLSTALSLSGTTGPIAVRAPAPSALGSSELDGNWNAALQRAAYLVLDIVREFLRTVLGEMHAVAAAQSANLAFKIRTLHNVPSLIIDETVPDIG
jgi:hypothetical protein